MKPKTKTKSSCSSNGSEAAWGLGLLLVFFFDEDNNTNHEQQQEEEPKYKFHSRRNKLSSSSSSSFLSPFITTSTHNHHLLISRAQSTISICALIFFFTLLLFTLSTFEPKSSIPSSPSSPVSKTNLGLGFSRRWLSEKRANSNSSPIGTINSKKKKPSSSISVALQGMGTLFRRGTKAMNNLLVAHLTEDTTDDELRLFLRSLHRSALMAKSDLVFIFPSSVVSSNLTTAIQEENESFLKLVHLYRNRTGSSYNGFDLNPFIKVEKKRVGGGTGATTVAETLWGRRGVESGDDERGELNGLSYGSVVGFEAGELDPEEALSGFFVGSHSPPLIQLRRWACYPMLLGRVRRNFKHVMLASVKDVVVVGDVLDRVRSHEAESVYLWKQSNKDSRRVEVTSDAIMGGIRGVRRLSNAMLNEIVRAAIRASGRSRNSSSIASESVILSQFVKNESLMKKLEVVVSVADEMAELTQIPASGGRNKFVMAECGGTSNNSCVRCILTKEICSSTLHSSSIYKSC